MRYVVTKKAAKLTGAELLELVEELREIQADNAGMRQVQKTFNSRRKPVVAEARAIGDVAVVSVLGELE